MRHLALVMAALAAAPALAQQGGKPTAPPVPDLHLSQHLWAGIRMAWPVIGPMVGMLAVALALRVSVELWAAKRRRHRAQQQADYLADRIAEKITRG
jgi:hypothetical protein